MFIQNVTSHLAAATTNYSQLERRSIATPAEGFAAFPAKVADNLTLSQDARDRLASEQSANVETRLAAIKGTPTRTAEDMNYLLTHDTKFIAICDKQNNGIGLTSSEINYDLECRGTDASGLKGINPMASLSADEIQMHDDLIASGNKAAAGALSAIGMTREIAAMEGVEPSPGLRSELTATNIRQHILPMFKNADAETHASFEALIQYLGTRLA